MTSAITVSGRCKRYGAHLVLPDAGSVTIAGRNEGISR
jgi:hypothetical protein